MKTYDVVGIAGVSLIAVALVYLALFVTGLKDRPRAVVAMFYGSGTALIAVAAL